MILAHNNTKLFISQGGTISLQESLYHGVPVLVMPIAFDQPTNARIAQKNGYGRYFSFSNFSEENFLYEIRTILSNKMYVPYILINVMLKRNLLYEFRKTKMFIKRINETSKVSIFHTYQLFAFA